VREVEQKLSPLSKDPGQEARHGEDDVAMRDGPEYLLLQPLTHRSCFFFSHDGQKLRPRQEDG
jgi:hypothetical protein